ncbi:MAG: response regulator, partial [Tenericutes bacterium]|nr:response regulator [Mycoplasmatota bacterium]
PKPISEAIKEVKKPKVDEKLDCSAYTAFIVDDNNLNIKVAKRLLEQYKFKVESVTNGKDCIYKVKEGMQYDIIFMDHMMPEMDGIETVRILRRLDDYEIPPIIALTANVMNGMGEKYLSEGFDGYLPMPIDTLELDRIIHKFFGDKTLGVVGERSMTESHFGKPSVDRVSEVKADTEIRAEESTVEKAPEVKEETETKVEEKPTEEKTPEVKAEVETKVEEPTEENVSEVKEETETKVEEKSTEEKTPEVKVEVETKVEEPTEEKTPEVKEETETKVEEKPTEEKAPEVKEEVETKVEEKPTEEKAPEVKEASSVAVDKSDAAMEKYLRDNGVDMDNALGLLGDMEMYNMTLGDFIADVPSKWSRINEYKTDSNMHDYAIEVHSLKSDCKYLGFMKLADISYQHELKSKENDSAFVDSNFEELVLEYEKILKLVNEYLDRFQLR